MRFLRYNTAQRITVGPFLDKTDGVTPETGIDVTACKLTATADVAGVPTLILDAAPTAAAGNNDMVHIAGDDAGLYDLELTAADTNYLGRYLVSLGNAAVHAPVWHEFMVIPQALYDFWIGADRLDVNVTHVGDTAQTARDIGASVIAASVTARVTADVDRVDGAALGAHSAGYFPGDTRQFGGAAGTFAGGRPEVNTSHLAGTAQTGRDIGASVLVGDKTGFSLSAAGILAIWHQLTADIVTAGTIGTWILAKLNVVLGDVKTKTDLIAGTPAVAGDAMALTVGERGAVAAAVESALLDEEDSRAVQEAIVAKIAEANPDLGDLSLAAIALAVRDSLLAGSDPDTIGGVLLNLNSRLPLAGTLAVAGDVPSAATIAATTRDVSNLAPAANSLGAAVNTANNAAAIAALNNLSAAEARTQADDALAAYDAPTKAEMDAGLAPLATAAALGDVPTNAELTAALGTADDALLAAIGGLVFPTAAEIADAVHNGDPIAGTRTHAELMRAIAAVLAGKGRGTVAAPFRDLDDTKDVVAMTVAEDGERTAVVLDLTP